MSDGVLELGRDGGPLDARKTSWEVAMARRNSEGPDERCRVAAEDRTSTTASTTQYAAQATSRRTRPARRHRAQVVVDLGPGGGVAVEQGVGVTEDPELLALGRARAHVVEVQGDPPPFGDLALGPGVAASVRWYTTTTGIMSSGRVASQGWTAANSRAVTTAGTSADHPPGEGQDVHQGLATDAEDLETVDQSLSSNEVEGRAPLRGGRAARLSISVESPGPVRSRPVGGLPVPDDGGEEADPGDDRDHHDPAGSSVPWLRRGSPGPTAATTPATRGNTGTRARTVRRRSCR